MSRSREAFESDGYDEASPLTKKQRIGDGDVTHTTYGTRHHEDGGVSTFAINYDECDIDLDNDEGVDDEAASPGWTGGSVGGDERPKSKTRSKPWRARRRSGGGSMHDANLYRHYRPDFRELAREYPDTFGPHVMEDPETGRATIDWADPAAMRELTRVMLRHDFGLLEWDAPLDRLCPPVANRLNYICWLSDLMKLSLSSKSSSPSSPSASTPAPPLLTNAAGDNGGLGSGVGDGSGDAAGGETAAMSAAQRNLLLFGTTSGVTEGGREDMTVSGDEDNDEHAGGGRGEGGRYRSEARAFAEIGCARGIDIGTGASCIYPLLGAKVAGMSFMATEIDAVSAEWAEKNVRSNGLQDRISVRLVPTPSDEADDDAPGPLLTALREEDGDFDFSMTNPPFFECADQAGQNPDTATAEMATAGEVSCPGGEVAFVQAIIRDSLRLRQRVRWYTSMVGKKANAKKLLRILREAGVKNTRTTEFFQGRTVRWGLAWSFTSEGMVGDKVPDDPGVKVFSKKKAADRAQHNLRSFSAPLRPSPVTAAPDPTSAPPAVAGPASAGDLAGGAGEGGSGVGAGNTAVKITVPANLPADASDVVERLKHSLMAFRQANIKVEAIDEVALVGNPAPTGERRFRCEALPRPPEGDRGGSIPSSAAPAASAGAAAASAASADSPTTVLLAFELEVHCAAEWAGAAAAQAAVQVWARLEEGGDRAAFQRLWEALQMDVLRQNRRWRRELTRAAAGGGGGLL